MNEIALAFVKKDESCKLVAYRDGGGVWTIGWGATGSDVGYSTVWTQSQADLDLEVRLTHIEKVIMVRVPGLSEQQYAALISFAYNLGVNTGSSLYAFIRAKNWIAAGKVFPLYDHDNGVEIKGLLKRRMEEAALFLEGS